jgi:hypothetical protein
VSWELATTRIFACYSLRMAGRLRELCERFDRYTADADRTGDRYLATNLRTYHSIVWLIRDDCARASKDIEGILDAWPGDRYQWQHFTHLFARCEQALYAGQPEAAFAAMSAEDARIRRSAMLKINGIRLEYAWLWARIALAMAEGAPESESVPFLPPGAAEREVLAQVRSSDRGGHGGGHRGGRALALAGADPSAGLRALEHAVATAEAAGANLLAESGRRWLGEIVGGSRGEELLARSSGWMAEQGVQNPARLAYMIVPGFQAPRA